ncbi:hypothetical protein KFL_002060115 [Klebsormidium nitens]|uniref:Uncharacterized protein n=1 Tax=Klebsormidium nitens TaxID=105231 RepID=A0A1Y1I1K4_KLENI|nr:hypothetical protein KFL_002060115 [Klebsormidium nitens]|eukprot:GAQ84790.1 hypothetical protein KFL_002060115 [Klebsormidium nitens]
MDPALANDAAAAILRAKIEKAADDLLQKPDFVYSIDSLESFCADKPFEFSRSNTKEYFKYALIGLRGRGLPQAEDWAASRILDAIEAETAQKQAIAKKHAENRKRSREMARTSHSQNISGESARGYFTVKHYHYDADKDGVSSGSAMKSHRNGLSPSNRGHSEAARGAGSRGSGISSKPAWSHETTAANEAEGSDDDSSLPIKRARRDMQARYFNENAPDITNSNHSKERGGVGRSSPARAVFAEHPANLAPENQTEHVAQVKEGADSPTKVALECMIAAKADERRKYHELHLLLDDEEADGEAARRAQAEHVAALLSRKRFTDEFKAAELEKKKQVLGRSVASPSSTAPGLSADRVPSAGSTGKSLGALAGLAAKDVTSPGHFRQARQATSGGLRQADMFQVGAPLGLSTEARLPREGPFNSSPLRNSPIFPLGLPPRPPQLLYPNAATGRGTSALMLTGDAGNMLLEQVPFPPTHLAPLPETYMRSLTPWRRTLVHEQLGGTAPLVTRLDFEDASGRGFGLFADRSRGGEASLKHGARELDAEIGAQLAVKPSPLSRFNDPEANGLGQKTIAAGAKGLHCGASGASGLKGDRWKGETGGPLGEMDEVEDGEIVDDVEGSAEDEKLIVPAGGNGALPESAQLDVVVKGDGRPDVCLDVVEKQQHGAANEKQITLDVTEPQPNAPAVVNSLTSSLAPNNLDNKKVGFTISSTTTVMKQINPNGQQQTGEHCKNVELSSALISTTAAPSDGADSVFPVGSQSDVGPFAADDKKVHLPDKVEADVRSDLPEELEKGTLRKDEDRREDTKKLLKLNVAPAFRAAKGATSSNLPKDGAPQPGEKVEDVGVASGEEEEH